MYRLTSQLRRATVGIPANIAEGSGRGTQPDYARFVGFPIGSACEAETLLILSEDLGLMPSASGERLREHVRRIRTMAVRFRQRLGGSKGQTID